MESTVTAVLLGYFAFGACFGPGHLDPVPPVQRGPQPPAAPGEDDGWRDRLVWVMLCTGLWPLMVLTGLFGLWQRRRVAATPPRER